MKSGGKRPVKNWFGSDMICPANYTYHLLFAAIAIIYLFNMFIDIMEIDAAQYALISLEMSWTKNFLQIFQQGQDYLDKPPLLFWLSSLSFTVFGISNFTYKLPSVLIAILGIYSVFRYSLLFYRKEVAIMAALILASSQALFLITNDVRTDTNLLGLTIFSMWQLSAYLKERKTQNLILAAIGVGSAMLAKGPIGIVVPAAAIGFDLILKRDWKKIFNPCWILFLLIVALILVPMSYGLYTQFDLHPEKTVYGLESPSGLRFYYWTQSFGRITGDNYWSNDTGFFYFFYTILWDFQPWIFMFIPALLLKLKKLIEMKFKVPGNMEYMSTGGFILIFLALSMSNYKLPHYIFVLLPFAAVITAEFIFSLKEKLQSRIAVFYFIIMHLFWMFIIVYFILFFPPQNFFIPMVLLIAYSVNITVFILTVDPLRKIILPTVISITALNFMLAADFYPKLLSYQSGSSIGKYIEKNHRNKNVFCFHHNNLALDFYARRFSKRINKERLSSLNNGDLLVTTAKGWSEIKHDSVYTIIEEFPSYKVSRLKLPFLIKKTRDAQISKAYLIEIKHNQ